MTWLNWTQIKDWQCYACGRCCYHFIVNISDLEAYLIAEKFGWRTLKWKRGKGFEIRKRYNRCVFLIEEENKNYCLLQFYKIKPFACKIYPFFVSLAKKNERDKAFKYKEVYFKVLVNNFCKYVIEGKPSENLMVNLIPSAISMFINRFNLGINIVKPNPYELLTSTKIKPEEIHKILKFYRRNLR